MAAWDTYRADASQLDDGEQELHVLVGSSDCLGRHRGGRSLGVIVGGHRWVVVSAVEDALARRERLVLLQEC